MTTFSDALSGMFRLPLPQLETVSVAALPANPNDQLPAITEPQPEPTAKPSRDAYMTLDRYPATPEASAAVDALVARIVAWERKAGGRKNQRRGKQLVAFREVVGAVLADLALAASREDPACFRSLQAKTFTGQRVAYRPFIAIMAALEALHLVHHRAGYFRRFGFVGVAGEGKAARWTATAGLRKLMREEGIQEEAVRDHFPVLRYSGKSLRLVRPKHWQGGREVKATEIKVNPPTLIKVLGWQMRELDHFIHQHRLEGGAHDTYRRDFYCDGDPASYGWEVGGRFFSVGPDSYQDLPKDQRRAMRINGEPVAELDVSACGLTIYCQRVGQPLDLSDDPYAVPGLERRVVKEWVTLVLQGGAFRKGWAEDTPAEIKKVPVAVVQAIVLQHLPALAELPKAGIRAFDLWYLESCTIVATMLRLKRHHGVVSLNMHDGLIVQARHAELAQEVLAEEFEKHIGCRPKVKVK